MRGNVPVERREAKFQPAGPTGDHGADREGHVTELSQRLLLEIGQRVAVSQQERSASGTDQREDAGGALRSQATGLDAPLESGEGNDEHDE